MARIFPKKLNRVRYFCYNLALLIALGGCSGVLLPLINSYRYQQDMFSTESLVMQTAAVGLNVSILGFKLLMLDMPRIRSIGWSTWTVLLMVIPFVNALMQILLLILPMNFFDADDSLMKNVLQKAKARKRK